MKFQRLLPVRQGGQSAAFGSSEPFDATDLAGTLLLDFKIREHIQADFFVRLQPLINEVSLPKTPVACGQK